MKIAPDVSRAFGDLASDSARAALNQDRSNLEPSRWREICCNLGAISNREITIASRCLHRAFPCRGNRVSVRQFEQRQAWVADSEIELAGIRSAGLVAQVVIRHQVRMVFYPDPLAVDPWSRAEVDVDACRSRGQVTAMGAVQLTVVAVCLKNNAADQSKSSSKITSYDGENSLLCPPLSVAVATNGMA